MLIIQFNDNKHFFKFSQLNTTTSMINPILSDKSINIHSINSIKSINDMFDITMNINGAY